MVHVIFVISLAKKGSRISHNCFNLIGDKIGKNLEYLGTGEIFLNRTPLAYALRAMIDKWNLIKLKSFCKARDTICSTKC